MPITREILENLENSELNEIIEIARDIRAQRIEYEKYRILNAFHKLVDEANNINLVFYEKSCGPIDHTIDPDDIYLA